MHAGDAVMMNEVKHKRSVKANLGINLESGIFLQIGVQFFTCCIPQLALITMTQERFARGVYPFEILKNLFLMSTKTVATKK